MKKEIAVSEGSENIFADLEIRKPDEALVKAELARNIARIISRKKLTQAKAGELLGIDQAKVSALMRGRLIGFSVERLMALLNLLGRDIEIVVKRHRRMSEDGGPRHGHIKVVGI